MDFRFEVLGLRFKVFRFYGLVSWLRVQGSETRVQEGLAAQARSPMDSGIDRKVGNAIYYTE